MDKHVKLFSPGLLKQLKFPTLFMITSFLTTLTYIKEKKMLMIYLLGNNIHMRMKYINLKFVLKHIKI